MSSRLPPRKRRRWRSEIVERKGSFRSLRLRRYRPIVPTFCTSVGRLATGKPPQPSGDLNGRAMSNMRATKGSIVVFFVSFFSMIKQQSLDAFATRQSDLDCENAGAPSLAHSATAWSVSWYASIVATPSMSFSASSTGRAFIVTKYWPWAGSAATASACIRAASRISLTEKANSRAACARMTPTLTSPSIPARRSSRSSSAVSGSSTTSSAVDCCRGS
eukprot:scaffold7500_cov127-Isochrysis_galbana.AAC.23